MYSSATGSHKSALPPALETSPCREPAKEYTRGVSREVIWACNGATRTRDSSTYCGVPSPHLLQHLRHAFAKVAQAASEKLTHTPAIAKCVLLLHHLEHGAPGGARCGVVAYTYTCMHACRQGSCPVRIDASSFGKLHGSMPWHLWQNIHAKGNHTFKCKGEGMESAP